MKHTRLLAGWQWLGMVLMMCASVSAHALGTAPNTLVDNTASITYSVGAGPAITVESSPTGNSVTGVGNGTATTFYVDTKVDVNVDEQGAVLVQTSAGTTTAVTTFRVYNNSNATFDFQLTATDLDTGSTWPAGNDTTPLAGESLTSVTAYVDANGNGVYDVATDTATHIDALAPDDGSLATYATVFIVASIPAAYADAEIALVDLSATARINDGAATLGGALTETAGAGTLDNTGGTVADVVFADAATAYDATARNATDTDRGGYQIVSAQISIQKTVSPYWWNVNGLGNASVGNPQAIPGAYMRYTIVVSNAAAASGSATLDTISDTLAGTLAIDPDLVDSATGTATSAAGSGFSVTYTTATARTGAGTASYYTTTSSADGLDHDGSATGGVITATMGTLLPADAGNGYIAGELKPGDTVTIIFNAVVQ